MIIVNERGEYVEIDGNDNAASFNSAASELAALFEHNEWCWSGKTVTRDDIDWKMVTLMCDAAFIANTAVGNGYGTVTSGRIRCEARRILREKDNLFGITFYASFIVGV